MKRFLVSLFLVLLLPACSARSRGPLVSLVRDSKAAPLSSEKRSVLRSGAEEILMSCNFNSEAHEKLLPWSSDLGEEWGRRVTGDYLLVQYPTTRKFKTAGGVVETRALLMPLPPGQIPAQPLTRGEHGVVGYSKCSGTLIVEFTCSPPIESLMPASYHNYCEQYRAGHSVMYPPHDE